MQIENEKVVSFHYNLLDGSQQQIETTRNGEPVLFLVGAGNVLPSLEQAMLGKTVGDIFSITLPPEQAYGLRNENRKDRISSKYLKHEGKLTPGKVVRINTDQGMKTATVIKVGKFNVDIDLNHPLAGQAVTFEIEVTAIRDAEPEEITHGHAHGVGGHHHH